MLNLFNPVIQGVFWAGAAPSTMRRLRTKLMVWLAPVKRAMCFTDLGVRVMSEKTIGDEKAESAAEPEHVASEHDEALVEEWEDESFPASDPPSNY
ncbi:hypothetical protein GCM10025778_12480 [Paeniglutamicibacter antarcticus]|uniref:Uncharacterized protein n=1 Tax=Paeniglutamicibacter antarcticus TaxID=494023 RepID=A0ABP9TMP7_9MICC